MRESSRTSGCLSDTDKTRKSNVISVQLPLEVTLKGPVSDGLESYITMKMERSLDDGQLESKFERFSPSLSTNHHS